MTYETITYAGHKLNPNDWPENSINSMIRKGVTHFLGNEQSAKVTNDLGKGARESERNASLAAYQTAAIAALISGDLSNRGGGDPIANELRKLAMHRANAKKPAGMKVVDWGKSAELKKLFDEYRADPKLIAMAERNVADLAALDEME